MLDIIEKEDLVGKSEKTGGFMIDRLKAFQDKATIVGDVRGTGMLIGVEIIEPGNDKTPAADITKAVLSDSFKHGLMLSTGGVHGNVIRISPPLGLTREEAEKGLDIFEDSLIRHSRT